MTRSRLLIGVLALALVAAVVALVVVWRDRDQADDRADASAELVDASVAAEKVARETVTRMTTYDHRTAEEDFGWVDDAATDNFQENFDGADAISVVKSLKASAEGTVVDSAANAADVDHVKVLLFVDQKVRSEGERGYASEQSRVTVQMVREDGRWLVDEVQIDNVLNPQVSR